MWKTFSGENKKIYVVASNSCLSDLLIQFAEDVIGEAGSVPTFLPPILFKFSDYTRIQ